MFLGGSALIFCANLDTFAVLLFKAVEISVPNLEIIKGLNLF